MNGAINIKLEKAKRGFLFLAWGLYDLANQFFAMNVVSLYFVRWLTLEKHVPEIFYSISFCISTFLVAILAPVLGAASDITARRRPFLVYLTLLSIIFTIFLGLTESIFLALLFFAIANFGCQLAIVFYNAQMVEIAPIDKVGLVSGMGRMLGYSGAILALYLIKPIVLKGGYQATFIPTGFLFLIFSLPCMIFVKDRHPKENINLIYFLRKDRISETFRQLKATILDARQSSGLSDFLKAAFFGLCAVNIVILFMSVYATAVFGLNEERIIGLLTFSTIFAIAGSIFSGFISDYLGYKPCLCAVFILWAVSFWGGAFVKSAPLYWLIGALVGVSLGSTWVLARALAVRLVPQEEIGEMFGVFNLIGYLSGVAGSIFWGVILLFLSPLGELGYRIALLSLILFMVLGLVFLLRIPRHAIRQ